MIRIGYYICMKKDKWLPLTLDRINELSKCCIDGYGSHDFNRGVYSVIRHLKLKYARILYKKISFHYCPYCEELNHHLMKENENYCGKCGKYSEYDKELEIRHSV